MFGSSNILRFRSVKEGAFQLGAVLLGEYDDNEEKQAAYLQR